MSTAKRFSLIVSGLEDMLFQFLKCILGLYGILYTTRSFIEISFAFLFLRLYTVYMNFLV